MQRLKVAMVRLAALQSLYHELLESLDPRSIVALAGANAAFRGWTTTARGLLLVPLLVIDFLEWYPVMLPSLDFQELRELRIEVSRLTQSSPEALKAGISYTIGWLLASLPRAGARLNRLTVCCGGETSDGASFLDTRIVRDLFVLLARRCPVLEELHFCNDPVDGDIIWLLDAFTCRVLGESLARMARLSVLQLVLNIDAPPDQRRAPHHVGVLESIAECPSLRALELHFVDLGSGPRRGQDVVELLQKTLDRLALQHLTLRVDVMLDGLAELRWPTSMRTLRIFGWAPPRGTADECFQRLAEGVAASQLDALSIEWGEQSSHRGFRCFTEVLSHSQLRALELPCFSVRSVHRDLSECLEHFVRNAAVLRELGLGIAGGFPPARAPPLAAWRRLLQAAEERGVRMATTAPLTHWRRVMEGDWHL